MRTLRFLILVLLFMQFVGGPTVYAQSKDGGAFSAYLIGTYEKRLNFFTVLHIINPTTHHLKVVIAFYDDKEEFQKCLKVELTPNDLHEVNVALTPAGLTSSFGVVKIISYRFNPTTGNNEPFQGIVGFQRHCLVNLGFSESVLASVPTEYAAAELLRIASHCPL